MEDILGASLGEASIREGPDATVPSLSLGVEVADYGAVEGTTGGADAKAEMNNLPTVGDASGVHGSKKRGKLSILDFYSPLPLAAVPPLKKRRRTKVNSKRKESIINMIFKSQATGRNIVESPECNQYLRKQVYRHYVSMNVRLELSGGSHDKRRNTTTAMRFKRLGEALVVGTASGEIHIYDPYSIIHGWRADADLLAMRRRTEPSSDGGGGRAGEGEGERAPHEESQDHLAPICSFEAKMKNIEALAWHPYSKYKVAVGGSNCGEVSIMDLNDGSVESFRTGKSAVYIPGQNTDIAFACDSTSHGTSSGHGPLGNSFAVCNDKGFVHLFDIRKNIACWTMNVNFGSSQSGVNSILFPTFNDYTIMVGTDYGEILAFDARKIKIQAFGSKPAPLCVYKWSALSIDAGLKPKDVKVVKIASLPTSHGTTSSIIFALSCGWMGSLDVVPSEAFTDDDQKLTWHRPPLVKVSSDYNTHSHHHRETQATASSKVEPNRGLCTAKDFLKLQSLRSWNTTVPDDRNPVYGKGRQCFDFLSRSSGLSKGSLVASTFGPNVEVLDFHPRKYIEGHVPKVPSPVVEQFKLPHTASMVAVHPTADLIVSSSFESRLLHISGPRCHHEGPGETGGSGGPAEVRVEG